MRLCTDITPRGDGTVIVLGLDRKTRLVFRPGADGVLAADIPDDGLAAHLLSLGSFFPDSPEDADAAARLVADRAGDADDDGDMDPDDPDGTGADAAGGQPIEARTPAKSLKPSVHVGAGGVTRKRR